MGINDRRSFYMILICFWPCQKRFERKQRESVELVCSNIVLLGLSATWQTVESFLYVSGVLYEKVVIRTLYMPTHCLVQIALREFISNTKVLATNEESGDLSVFWNTSFKNALSYYKPITILANVINGFCLRLIFEFFQFHVWRGFEHFLWVSIAFKSQDYIISHFKWHWKWFA